MRLRVSFVATDPQRAASTSPMSRDHSPVHLHGGASDEGIGHVPHRKNSELGLIGRAGIMDGCFTLEV